MRTKSEEAIADPKEKSFRVWEDGFSPIVFGNLEVTQDTDLRIRFIQKVLSAAKNVCRRNRVCYVVLNFSCVHVSKANTELFSEIKFHLKKPFIKAVAVVAFEGMKYQINMQDYSDAPLMKCFRFFEQALGFINEQRRFNP